MKGDNGNKDNAELQEMYGEQDLVVFKPFKAER
jgi:hypothetical protein